MPTRELGCDPAVLSLLLLHILLFATFETWSMMYKEFSFSISPKELNL